LSLAVLLLACGAAVGLLTISMAVGPFELLGSQGRGLSAVGLWLPPSAGSVESTAARRRFRSWRAALSGGAALHQGASLDELRAAGAAVVVVIDGHALSQGEIASLRAFVEAGGGAIATGALAIEDADGDWRGWRRMARLLHVDRVHPLTTNATALAAGRRGPLSAGLRPEELLQLLPQPGAPAIDDDLAEILWSASSGRATAGPRGASRRVTIGDGRLVWLAAGPERSAGGATVPGSEFERLASSAVAWVSRQPFVEVLPWPGRATFAAVVEPHPLRAPPGREPRSRAATAAQLREAVERASRGGALAPLGRIASPQPPAVRDALLTGLLPELRRRGAWLGDEGAVQAWRRQRGALATSLVWEAPGRHLLEVTNRGNETVRGAVLRVHLNAPAERAGVDRTVLRQGGADFWFDRRAQRVDVAVPDLAPGASIAYSLDLEARQARSGT
jgi:hypothetical protein